MTMTKILIIDDDPNVVGFLTNVLTDHDYEVVSADNGADGLQIARDEVPDLILLDIEMPTATGPDFYRRLRREKALKGTPVIVVSGYHSKHIAVTRDVPVLEKPVDEELLLTRVRESLAAARST
jgi:two-component system cell cycle response regulator DivK